MVIQLYCYTANTTVVNNNTTYALTYYSTAGNPFGTNYTSYTMTTYPANAIPLNKFIGCYILLTNMTNSCVGTVEMPHGMLNGQQIILKTII